jgi:ABC-type sugar transport system ATPase subunit
VTESRHAHHVEDTRPSAHTLELVGVSKNYGLEPAVKNVTLSIGAGEFLVLLGPSGCGKSTILKMIAGLEDVSEGEIYIRGELANYLPAKRRDVAMVFQNYALYPHMTVRKNLAFPLRMRNKLNRNEAELRAGETAKLLGLSHHLDKYPEQLSGGQRQRVALGRAIIREPAAFLMDEPLSNLDAVLRADMRSELLRLHRRVGRTTVYVTHDQVEAMTMADRIVVLNEGRVQQIGSPFEIYSTPANTFVAGFVGSPKMNLYQGRLSTDGGEAKFAGGFDLTYQSSLSIALDDEVVTLGVRPEDVITHVGMLEGAPIRGLVSIVEPMGADVFLEVELNDGGRCVVRTQPQARIREGQQVGLEFPETAIHIFDEQGQRLTTPSNHRGDVTIDAIEDRVGGGDDA